MYECMKCFHRILHIKHDQQHVDFAVWATTRLFLPQQEVGRIVQPVSEEVSHVRNCMCSGLILLVGMIPVRPFLFNKVQKP